MKNIVASSPGDYAAQLFALMANEDSNVARVIVLEEHLKKIYEKGYTDAHRPGYSEAPSDPLPVITFTEAPLGAPIATPVVPQPVVRSVPVVAKPRVMYGLPCELCGVYPEAGKVHACRASK